MPHPLIKSAFGLALGFLMISPAMAVPFTLPETSLGNFQFDNDVEQFDFSIGIGAVVTIETVSFLGGDSVSDPVVPLPGGGFDPILTLYDSTGTVLAFNDDIDTPGGDWDALIELTLDPGIYTVALTQYINFFDGDVGDNISNGFLFDGPSDNFTGPLFGCSNGSFCADGGENRSSFYAVNFSAQAVPEPGTLALLGFGLVGAGVFYRRRRQD
ncbi:MAG: DVUA0089 family protein [Pseudomonadota bacterium]